MKRVTLLAIATVVATSAHAQATKAPSAAKAKGYPKDMPAALVKEAKITEPQAAAIALKAVPGATIDKMELEKEDEKFIYSYDLKTAGKKGIDEVHVDAMTGALLGRAHETPADEKAEAAKEKAESKKAPAKKPPTLQPR
jgi:uncharacterized membrane protein YkoI